MCKEISPKHKYSFKYCLSVLSVKSERKMCLSRLVLIERKYKTLSTGSWFLVILESPNARLLSLFPHFSRIFENKIIRYWQIKRLNMCRSIFCIHKSRLSLGCEHVFDSHHFLFSDFPENCRRKERKSKGLFLRSPTAGKDDKKHVHEIQVQIFKRKLLKISFFIYCWLKGCLKEFFFKVWMYTSFVFCCGHCTVLKAWCVHGSTFPVNLSFTNQIKASFFRAQPPFVEFRNIHARINRFNVSLALVPSET